MKLTVKRLHLLDTCTIGMLIKDGCPTGIFTLEPKVRDHKILGCTAISPGTYKVVVDFSNHFGKDLPHVLDVPEFEGVRIHPGNTDKDTEGCILVGDSWEGGDFIGHSGEAFAKVFQWIKDAPSTEIEIQ